MCKIIQVRSEIQFSSLWMLIVAMADFKTAAAFECRNIHAVIINQPELSLHHKHVAVLQVAVCDLRLTQIRKHFRPCLSQIAQRHWGRQVLLDIGNEAVAVNPPHPYERIPGRTYTNTVRHVLGDRGRPD